MAKRYFFVYVMTNKNATVLYTGVTGDLAKRSWQHRTGQGCTFSKRYRTTRLIHYEIFQTAGEAIAREKQIKGWRREKKQQFILERNPGLRDLYEEAQEMGIALRSGGHVILG